MRESVPVKDKTSQPLGLVKAALIDAYGCNISITAQNARVSACQDMSSYPPQHMDVEFQDLDIRLRLNSSCCSRHVCRSRSATATRASFNELSV